MTELVVDAEGRRTWRRQRRRQRVLPPVLGFFLLLRPRHPAQFVLTAFALAIAVGTALLMLPAATRSGDGAPFLVALFTATSATCVTGLTVVDTETYWSTFGHVVILGGIQTGGFGVMTLASMLGLVVSRRLGLRTRLLAQAETKTLALGDLGRVLRGVAVVSLVFESGTALLLALRFWLSYDMSLGTAAWQGVFHAISAFNNAGFGLRSDNLVAYVTDPFVCVPVLVAVVAGGLGFPVLFELRHEFFQPRIWSTHTKLTVLMTGTLLVAGPVVVTALEWSNPGTLGPLSTPGKLLAGVFQGLIPRTAGFNTVDYAQMEPATWFTTDVLMFIGGGSASTAGGIKVTTFVVLLFAIVAEARGITDVDAFGRRLPPTVIRQALTVALLGVAVVVCGTLAMLVLTGRDLDQVLFETISAFATVGLTTGITADLPASAQYLLVAIMFVGRTGTITLASALALRERHQLYRLPEGRPVVG